MSLIRISKDQVGSSLENENSLKQQLEDLEENVHMNIQTSIDLGEDEIYQLDLLKLKVSCK